MEYYYAPPENVDLNGNNLELDEFEYKHLVKALRKKEGDLIDVTDGKLNVYRCEISRITKDRILCNIRARETNLYEPALQISLYISPLKNQDRLEFCIEKAVELGVYSVNPVFTLHTINKSALSDSKIKRLEKIMISAMGQSQRCRLPVLKPAVSFEDMIKETGELENKAVMYEFAEGGNEFKKQPASDKVALLIGPEGGFSETEINTLKDNKWQTLSLGKRKLRAETAAIVSVFDLINKYS